MRRREFCQQIGIAIGLYAFSRRSYAFQITGQELDLPRKAHDALVRAVRFFDERVSVEGGYVWAYSEDLRFREGEGPATPSTAWVSHRAVRVSEWRSSTRIALRRSPFVFKRLAAQLTHL